MRRIGGVVFVGLLTAAGCTLQGKCETVERHYCVPAGVEDPLAWKQNGVNVCHATLLDPYTWESNPPNSDWLPYDGQTQWILELRDAKTGATLQGRFVKVTSYIATQPSGVDAVQTAGNLAEVIGPGAFAYSPGGQSGGYNLGPTQARVWNTTCANYYVRVVVESRPTPDLDGGRE